MPAQRTALLVAGMHRSGTSATTRVISLLGADLPSNLMPSMACVNETGFWESLDFYDLNERILATLDSGWDDWRRLDPQTSLPGLKAQAREILERNFAESELFVFKDPRVCRLLPFWLESLRQFGAETKCILPFRNPVEVASSLEQRDGFSPTKSYMLWLRHVLDAELGSRGIPRAFLSYAELLDDWRGTAGRIAEQLGLSWPGRHADAEGGIDRFLEHRLRHHVTDAASLLRNAGIMAWIKDTFRLLQDLVRDPDSATVQAALDRIRNEFDQVDTALVEALQSRDTALQEARQALVQRTAAADAATARLQAQDQRMGELEETASTQSARIRALEAAVERMEARNAELVRRHDATALEIKEYTTRLSRHDRRIAELNRSLSELQADTARQAQVALRYRDRYAALEQLSNGLLQRLNALQTARAWRCGPLVVTRQQHAHSTAWRARGMPPRLCAGRSLQPAMRRRLQREADRVLAAGLFDERWYIENNPAVVLAGDDPLWHWLVSGWREGRSPNPVFDTGWYQRKYPDVSAADLNPLLHYLDYGAAEGRDPGPLFDSDWYLAQNPDVRAAGVNPLVHYLNFGKTEGRDPGPLFDAAWYREQYPQVASSGADPLQHYLQCGAAEGCNPNPLFDSAWYLQRYPDVAMAGLNPLAHYLSSGAAEGRDPGPRFATTWYQSRYDDVGPSGLNPLHHYLQYGCREGRMPQPPAFDPARAWPSGAMGLLLMAAYHSDPACAARSWQRWRDEHPDLASIDWQSARVIAQASAALSRHETAAVDITSCSGISQFDWTRFDHHVDNAGPLLLALEQAGIRVMLSKGAAIHLSGVAPGSVRRMTDIDILIDPEQIDPFMDVAEACGWNSKWPLARSELRACLRSSRHSVPLSNGERLEVDLHTSALLLNRCPDHDAPMWQRGTEARFGAASVFLPSVTDMLVLTLGHGLLYTPRPMGIWVGDAIALIESGAVDWDVFLDEIERRDIAVFAYTGLEYLRAALARPVPAYVLDRLAGLLREPFIGEFLGHVIAPHPTSRTIRQDWGAAACARAGKWRSRTDPARQAQAAAPPGQAACREWQDAARRANGRFTITIPEDLQQAGGQATLEIGLPTGLIPPEQPVSVALTCFDYHVCELDHWEASADLPAHGAALPDGQICLRVDTALLAAYSLRELGIEWLVPGSLDAAPAGAATVAYRWRAASDRPACAGQARTLSSAPRAARTTEPGRTGFDLVMTLLVRDEEDIIAANIDYHRAQGVDFFIVMDNLSTDATPAILKAYEREGILHYIPQTRDDYSQGKWVTTMARLAYLRYGAKWVINSDADEFWWPLTATSLGELFRGLPEHCNIVEARRHNFVTVAGSAREFYDRMIYRERDSLNPLGQPLLPKHCHRGLEDIVVAQGNHAVSGFAAPHVAHREIEILHFPFRSLPQFQNKIVKGGAAYRRNTELPPEIGSTWRNLHAMLSNDGRLPDQVTAQVKHAGEIETGLRQGGIVEDRRLSEYMAGIRSALSPSSPGSGNDAATPRPRRTPGG
ncbi:MAG: nucleotidyltransferase family protein [Pseudomonadota bacterium]